MGLYRHLLRPLAFRLDPETVHHVGMRVIRLGVGGATHHDPRLAQTYFGHPFPNPIGLAAGFDKNALATHRWPRYGFGFTEIGTVTARPQPGNDRPRLFRLPKDHALINRLGFNNAGAEAVARNLRSTAIPVGINLGKNKDVEPQDAPASYAAAFRPLRGKGAYYVVNVSSPNTPGLRALQDKGALTDILHALRAEDSAAAFLVKVAPDLEREALDDVLGVVHDSGAAGIVATNTTLSRDGLTRDPGQAGGLSGAPLRDKADDVLAYLAAGSDARLVLVGVGGVFTAEDALRKIRLGAHLVQLYTGWVYGGPRLVARLLHGLSERMDEEDVRSLDDWRGSDLASRR